MALLLFMGLLTPGSLAAEEGGAEAVRPSHHSSLVTPVFTNWPMTQGEREMLRVYRENASKVRSGNVWVMATGRDPRLSSAAAPMAQGGAGALVPYRDPSAKFSRNILVPRDFSAAPLQTEPHIAVNPKDPNHLIIGMIDYNFPAVSSYVSIDGGVTWEGPALLKWPREEVASAGDPVVAFDREGNAHYIFITLDTEEFTIGNILGQTTVSSISMATSTDGGYTWAPATATSRSAVESQIFPVEGGLVRGEVSFEFLDKPWLAIGPNPQDPSKDVFYISYTKFISRYSVFYIGELPTLAAPVEETVIEVVRSEDGGLTWSAPVEVSPRLRQVILPGQNSGEATPPDGEAIDGAGDAITAPGGQVVEAYRRIVQGSQPTVAPDGTLYVGWMDTTDDRPFEGLAQIFVARSDDGGKTFSPGRRASTFLEPGFTPRTASFRYWGASFAQMAAGPEGEVYVAYTGLPAGKPADDGDIYIVRSLDKGMRWDPAVVVNDDETSGLQFFPSISVAPDGNVHAMWGDTRDNPGMDLQFHIYYALSEDKGQSFGLNARVTDSYSNPNYGFPAGEFIGDYFSIKATEEDVYMVWADTRLGEFQGTNQKIGFARQRQMPNPSIFLSPPQGPAATNVTIQGFNYQADQELFIQVGGAIVAQERTNPDGRFTTQLFFPIAGEGAQTVTVLDASGNTAAASYFNEFGFDNIADTASDVETIATNLGGAELESDIESIKTSLENIENGGMGGLFTLGLVSLVALVAGVGGGAGFIWWSRQKNGGSP
jgi:hypothetical protein